MGQMTVCQTCGDRGFPSLLINCVKCHIVAVHRYCVDGPPTIDDEETIWACEDCEPRVAKPALPSRWSERIGTRVNQKKGLRSKVPRNWRNNSCLAEAEKPDHVGKRAAKGTADVSDLEPKSKDSQQVESKESTSSLLHGVSDDSKINTSATAKIKSALPIKQSTGAKTKGAEPSSHPRKKNKDSNAKKNSCKSLPLPIQKSEDLNSHNTEGEDEQVRKNTGSPQSEEADDIKGDKHGQSFNQNDPVEQAHTIIKSLQAAKPPDCTEEEKSEVVEETTAENYVLDPRGEDVLSCSGISECQQTSRKKRRRLVIEMESSDEEADVGEKNLLHISSSMPPQNSDDHALVQLSPTKLNDHVATQPAPINPEARVHVLPQTPAVKLQNHVVIQHFPATLGNYYPAQPIAYVVWRGDCSISNSIYPITFGLEAHLSNKAHAKVHGAGSALPESIHFKIVPKRYAWPKNFENSPPSGDVIGLYFLPVDDRAEKLYENLLDKMIDCGQALISKINNLELIVFSSRELPQDEWRFQRKYYLWGVFRPKQETPLPSQISNVLSPNAPRCDTKYQKQQDLVITATAPGTSVSPSSMGRNSGTDSPTPAYSSQRGYDNDSQVGPSKFSGPTKRRYYPQPLRKFHKPRDKFHGGSYGNKGAIVPYHEKFGNRYNNRLRNYTWKRPVKDDGNDGGVAHYNKARDRERNNNMKEDDNRGAKFPYQEKVGKNHYYRAHNNYNKWKKSMKDNGNNNGGFRHYQVRDRTGD